MLSPHTGDCNDCGKTCSHDYVGKCSLCLIDIFLTFPLTLLGWKLYFFMSKRESCGIRNAPVTSENKCSCFFYVNSLSFEMCAVSIVIILFFLAYKMISVMVTVSGAPKRLKFQFSIPLSKAAPYRVFIMSG